MTQTAALVILSAGAVGYLAAFAMAVGLRIWLGRRAPGWPNILLNSLVFLLLLLLLLYLVSLANTLGFTRHLPYDERLLISFGAATALTIAPWGLVFALSLWWYKLDQEERS